MIEDGKDFCNNETVKKIVNYFKDEFKRKLKIALEPFTHDLKIPIQVVINFGSRMVHDGENFVDYPKSE